MCSIRKGCCAFLMGGLLFANLGCAGRDNVVSTDVTASTASTTRSMAASTSLTTTAGTTATTKAYVSPKSTTTATTTVSVAPSTAAAVTTSSKQEDQRMSAQLFHTNNPQGDNRYFGNQVTKLSINTLSKLFGGATYTVNPTGVRVREMTLQSVNREAKPTVIAFATDMHLNHEVAPRIAAVKNTMLTMKYADQIVLGGDNIDHANETTVQLFKELVFDEYSQTIGVFGNHETAPYYTDKERQSVVNIWPHDTSYYSRLVNDNVLVIAADDSQGYFTDEQAEMLKNDLSYARTNRKTVLLFSHIKINDYNMTLHANKTVYDLVVSYSDVVRGNFSGHDHQDRVYSIPANYTDANGATVENSIKAVTVEAAGDEPYCGHVLLITVA